jgi:hypothetical protein
LASCPNRVSRCRVRRWIRVGHLLGDVVVGFHQKAAGAAGRVEHGFAKTGVADLHHEAHHRARGVELARVASGVAHLAQHGFVQVREGVNLLAAAEVNAVDLVDDVAQQVAADHAVLHAAKHIGDDLALAAFLAAAGQAAQYGEQARPTSRRRGGIRPG